MPWRSEHYRTALANAAVRLTIVPEHAHLRFDGNCFLIDAIDADGSGAVIAIDASGWNSLCEEFGRDSLFELEQLALTGGWEPYGAGRVWRVILI